MRATRASALGQVLPAVLAALTILLIMVPLLVLYTQNEAKWTRKQADSTLAFHLAESGVEKAYLYMTSSTSTWAAIQLGQAPVSYRFDREFTDMDGGSYAVSITSGPGEQYATVISVGRDSKRRETRAIKAVYANTLFGATAIFAGKGVQIGSGVNVEWGAVLSPYTVDAGGRAHPQFWSASQITGFDTSPDPPNCDSPNCQQWHSYQANLPPQPSIDFDFYRSSAAQHTGCPAGGTPADSCYYAGSLANFNSALSGKTIFVEGDLTVTAPGMDVDGNLIVMGNVNLPNGAWGRGSRTMKMPPDAWKQYGNDWASGYRGTFDSAAPVVFPGLNSTAYTSPSVCAPASACTSTKIAVSGLLYVGGNFNNGGGGGGNSDVYGVLYSVGSTSASASSPINFFYNADAAKNIAATNVALVRVSWQDDAHGWPPGL